MKKFPFHDALFILLSAVTFYLIEYFGYSHLVYSYMVIVAMIAYFSGKYIGQAELRKKQNEDPLNG